MKREIETVKYTLTGPTPVKDPCAEIVEQSSTGRYQYLLAHADDGVIWGYIDKGKLVLSSDPDAFKEISPQLRNETLWEARLFGENEECFLWSAEDSWWSREITDGQGEEGEAFIESLILWGTDLDGQVKRQFSPMREADLGIRHSPPTQWEDRHKTRLRVKHYLDYDEGGVVYIFLSRLVDFE